MRARTPIPSCREFWAILVAGLIVGCQEAPTAGRSQIDSSRPVLLPPKGPSLGYEAVGSYAVGGVNALSSSFTDRTSPGPTLSNKKLLYRVTASGTVSAQRTPYWNNGPTVPAEGAYGPSGYSNGSPTGPSCYAKMYVGSTSTYGGETWYAPSCISGTSPLPTTASGHVYLAGATTIGRSSSTGGGQWDCYTAVLGYGPCFTWTDDGQAVTIDRVTATLSVAAAPATVDFGSTVTVTATISPGAAEGKDVPWTIDSVRWSPADGRYQQSPCSWADFYPQNVGAARTCQKPFTRSGVLTVFSTVNGDNQSQQTTVTVNKPTVTLTANPSAIRTGDSVTFTAIVSPSSVPPNIQGWEWKPDSGATGQGISGSCAWNNNPCKRAVTRSGTMKVRVTLDGLAD